MFRVVEREVKIKTPGVYQGYARGMGQITKTVDGGRGLENKQWEER